MVKIWLDTATDYLFLAITNDHEVIESIITPSEKKHSDTALYQLQALLQTHQIKNDEIQAVVIGAGPGSYSGIRIARTIAKTMQLVRPIESFQFSTLEFLGKLQQNENIALKAGRDQVYVRQENKDGLMSLQEKHTIFDAQSTIEQPLTLELLNSLEIEGIDTALPYYIKAAI